MDHPFPVKGAKVALDVLDQLGLAPDGGVPDARHDPLVLIEQPQQFDDRGFRDTRKRPFDSHPNFKKKS